MTQPRQRDPKYVPGYNGTGGTLSKGTLVKLKTSGVDDEIIAATSTSDAYLGILQHDLADGEWGDVQVGGIGVALSGAAVTKGSRVMWGTGAKVIACTTGLTFAGVARTTASGADEYIEVDIVTGGPVMP